MKIVIDIPEEIYKASQMFFKENKNENDVIQIPLEVIATGTPLPKGHGRLIDADALYEDLIFPNKQFDKTFKDILNDAQTIIEADKAESEG